MEPSPRLSNSELVCIQKPKLKQKRRYDHIERKSLWPSMGSALACQPQTSGSLSGIVNFFWRFVKIDLPKLFVDMWRGLLLKWLSIFIFLMDCISTLSSMLSFCLSLKRILFLYANVFLINLRSRMCILLFCGSGFRLIDGGTCAATSRT